VNGSRGLCVAVLGTKGAPGATTVAIRLAVDVATLGIPTALADLDPEGGDVTAYLGLDPRRNLFTLAHMSAGLLGEEVLRSEGQDLGGGLFVITGVPRREMAWEISQDLAGDVVERLGDLFPVVVCDVGRDPTAPLVCSAVDRADVVLLTARADLVGTWNAERVLAALPSNCRASTRLVVSRVRRGESPQELAAVLDVPLAAIVPLHAAEARRAVAAQRPMTGRGLRAIKSLARELASAPSPMSSESQFAVQEAVT